ncbi:winged helix-turn-helix domain-containing protein [Haliea sp.]
MLLYHFADFSLSTRRQCLYRHGEEVPLSTKLYHLLLAFVGHPDTVLTKADITRAAWPGQIVTDAAIAKQMQRLRQLLDDTEREVPLIETHRGMGYRLTCAVTSESQQPAGNAAMGSQHWPRRMAAALLLVTIAGWLALDLRESRSTATVPGPATLALQPVTDDASLLTEGASEYFAARLGSAAEIAPVLALEGEPAYGADLASLRLAGSRTGPVAAINLTVNEGAYALTVSLRDENHKSRFEFAGSSVAEVLEKGTDWLRAEIGNLGTAASTSPDSYALASYFAGLAATGSGHTCERAMEYYRAAVARDPDFHRARLRLARCERVLGRPHEAAAIAVALLANAEHANPNVLLQARLVAAQAHHDLGNMGEARRYLEAVEPGSAAQMKPLARLQTLAALTLLARLDGDTGRAIALNRERLALARNHYPLAPYLTEIHLALADDYLATGEHESLLSHAQEARTLAEESGNADALIASYRYLASSYFRNGDMDAAVQLALAARPLIKQTRSVTAKAYFLQFSTMALNLRGLFDTARDYTEALRALSEESSDPMYGAIADLTVMHRLYVQGAYAQAHALASSTRARLEVGTSAHAAIPLALSFEAIAASRSAPLPEAIRLVEAMASRYPDNPAVRVSGLRARGHIAAREGRVQDGVQMLRQAEALYRDTGMTSVANYVAYELAELRLASEPAPPWNDIERLSALADFDYPLAHLRARAHAAEGNYLGATTALEEARLRGNDLWTDRDQLLLEEYRSVLAMVDAGAEHEHSPGDIP